MKQTNVSDKDIALKYSIAWVGMVFVAIFNGILRGVAFEPYLDSLLAHQLSCVTGVLLFFITTWLLNVRWPIESSRQAIIIGLIWVTLTPIFEFVFGTFVMGHTIEYLLNDYNLLAGRTWSLVLLAVALLPTIVYRIRRK